MGRPKKLLTAEQVEMLPKLAGKGLSMEDIADLFGISDNTLRKRFNEDPNVAAEYKRGRAEYKDKATDKLWDLIDSGDKAAIFFYLKTQCGWRETNNVDVTSGGDKITNFTLHIPENGDGLVD